jgi:hypothetical protein
MQEKEDIMAQIRQKIMAKRHRFTQRCLSELERVDEK